MKAFLLFTIFSLKEESLNLCVYPMSLYRKIVLFFLVIRYNCYEGSDMNLELLNEEQREAVTYLNGPLLVLAGAGSGKTKVLTSRIAYLIEKGISPYNILAITFTNKAAAEMKERVIKLIGGEASSMQISTFHSFGLRIVRDNHEKLNLENNFAIFDSEDSLTAIKRVLKRMDLDSNKYNPKTFRNKISSFKNDLKSPDDAKRMSKDELDDLIAKVYLEYEEELRKDNGVDFDDLLLLPIKLFKENSDILLKYQERFKYILIDEYQDTNEAQYRLTKMLANRYQNLCVVGDSDQAIYGFRGANFKNILNFEKDYKTCKTIILKKNYRSTKVILDAANSVIKNNINRHPKDLESVNGNGELISYYRAKNGPDEINYIADTILSLQKKGESLDDIVILYRTNAQSRNFEDEFLKRNIPYRMIGAINFYARREIKDLMAYLKVINNPRDAISLLRSINTPKRGIGNKAIDDIISKSNEENISLFEAITNGKALTYKNMILELQEAKEHLSLTELVDLVLDKSGLKKELIDENSIEAETRLENLEEFKSITKAFEDKYGLISLPDFLYEVGLISDNTEISDSQNRVTLMTVHAVKGLEFKYCFITGLEEGLFPHMNSMNSSEEIEEERRLCYVAITRAKEKLYLTNAMSRILYGNSQVNPVSRFIKEIDDNLLKMENQELDGFIKQNAIPKKVLEEEIVNTEFNPNDYVFHDTFGTGKVISVDKTVIKVAFKMPYGIKTLMKNHPSLHKV